MRRTRCRCISVPRNSGDLRPFAVMPSLVELTEDACQELSQRMSVVIAAAPVKVSIKHFVPDPVKSGGAYRVTRGRFLRVDSSRSAVVLAGGVTILLDNIVEIDSPALDKFL